MMRTRPGRPCAKDNLAETFFSLIFDTDNRIGVADAPFCPKLLRPIGQSDPASISGLPNC
jgi:hypothetical protein